MGWLRRVGSGALELCHTTLTIVAIVAATIVLAMVLVSVGGLVGGVFAVKIGAAALED